MYCVLLTAKSVYYFESIGSNCNRSIQHWCLQQQQQHSVDLCVSFLSGSSRLRRHSRSIYVTLVVVSPSILSTLEKMNTMLIYEKGEGVNQGGYESLQYFVGCRSFFDFFC